VGQVGVVLAMSASLMTLAFTACLTYSRSNSPRALLRQSNSKARAPKTLIDRPVRKTKQ